MFLNERYSLFLTLYIIFYSMFPSTNCISTYSKPYFKNAVEDTKDYKLLASMPTEGIFLYAIDWKEQELEHSGVYKDILLDIKGKKHRFSWVIDSNESFSPKLTLNDIDNDNVDELIIISTTATGTGLLIQDIHIFKIDTFMDINLINPLEVIHQNVETKITKKNDNIIICTNINGNIVNLIAKESSAGIWFDNVAFGGTIEYDLVNDEIIAKVGAQVSPSLYVGYIKINYTFKNNQLEPRNINFNELKRPEIFKKIVK